MRGRLTDDYLAALDRLIAEVPQHDKLKKGVYRISPSTVAQEAGHSRNNLYLEEYESVLDAIREARPRPSRPKKSQPAVDEKMAELRAELKQVRSQLAALGSENAFLFARVTEANSRIERLMERLRKNTSDLEAARLRRASS